jgi:PAS domain S-box-containing protein
LNDGKPSQGAPLQRNEPDRERLAAMSRMLIHARARAFGLRKQAAETPSEAAWSGEALQELHTAHEELRVTEEELHAQADVLLATQAELDSERRRYLELFNDAPVPYLTTDANGLILQANRRALQLFDVRDAFLIGRPLPKFVSAADRSRVRDALSLVATHDSVCSAEFSITQPRAPSSRRVTASLCRAQNAERPSFQVRWVLCVSMSDPQCVQGVAETNERGASSSEGEVTEGDASSRQADEPRR